MGRACARVSVDYFSSPLSLSPSFLLSPLSLIFENCLVLGTFCLDGVGYGLDLQRSRENSYPSSLQKRRFGLTPTIFADGLNVGYSIQRNNLQRIKTQRNGRIGLAVALRSCLRLPLRASPPHSLSSLPLGDNRRVSDFSLDSPSGIFPLLDICLDPKLR